MEETCDPSRDLRSAWTMHLQPLLLPWPLGTPFSPPGREESSMRNGRGLGGPGSLAAAGADSSV